MIPFNGPAVSGRLRLIFDILRAHTVYPICAAREVVIESSKHLEFRFRILLRNRFGAVEEPHVATDTASVHQEIPFPSSFPARVL